MQTQKQKYKEKILNVNKNAFIYKVVDTLKEIPKLNKICFAQRSGLLN